MAFGNTMSVLQDVVMWEMFARARPFRAILHWVILLPLSCCAAAGQRASATAQGMYFVAGTPTNKSPETNAVVLYAGRSDKELTFVRTVVTKSDGLYWILDDLQSTLAVAYPHINPTAVSIIHKGDPGREDVVVFNPMHLDTIDLGTTVVEAADQSTYAVFPTVTNNSGDTRRTSLVEVLLSFFASKGRLNDGKVEDYAGIRVAGVPGGPAFGLTPSGEHLDNGIYMAFDEKRYRLIDLSGLKAQIDGSYVDILAASKRFLAFYPSRNMDQLQGVTFRTIFVYDFLQRSWKEIRQPGNLSRVRFCGPWLVTIQQQERNLPPGEIRARPPDRVDAREQGESPGVRLQYGSFQGAISEIPGVLIMDNLEDGRRLTIDTGREDSEVLFAGEDSVTYRVNDEIYHAEIQGTNLQAPALLVKSKEVPEIHWAFLGNPKQ